MHPAREMECRPIAAVAYKERLLLVTYVPPLFSVPALNAIALFAPLVAIRESTVTEPP